MKYKDQYIQRAEKDMIISWISINLHNYLKNNEENLTEIEHIIDFLNSNKAPIRIKYMSYEEAKSGSEKWTATMIKKAADIVETEADVKVFKDYGDGFKFVELIEENAFKREGNLMSHCVGSYYGKAGIKVLSLRDELNKPHCTIEISEEHGNMSQIKGKGNGSIHPKYIKYILDILKELKCEVRSSELNNLGYLEVSSGTWKLLESNFTNVKYLQFNNKKYFYQYSNLKAV